MHCTKQSNTKQTGTMIGKGDGEKTSSTTGGGGGDGESSAAQPPPAHPPKILLAKPGLVNVSPSIRGGSGGDDETTSLRSRLPSLNLLSDSSDFHFDRFLPFLTDNTEFTVVGVIGQPGVGKSTIMNEIYGFDPTSPGMLPPFATQSEEIRANARHCTVGIEPRISAERIILLDTQPVFTPSVLVDITRPDGSSTVPILGETLSAELAHELMGIQLGVLLASVCHILLVVAEGVHDANMWRLMSTVELLKHAIPDPSSTNIVHSQSSISGSDKEYWERFQEGAGEEYMAAPIFVHTKLRDEDFNSHTCKQMKKALARYFSSSSFTRTRLDSASVVRRQGTPIDDMDTERLKLFLIPFKKKDEAALRAHHESYDSCLWRVGDQVLSMKHPIFKRTISEREWLKNTAKIWDLLKNSPLIAEYCKMLQNSGMFRK